MPILPLDTSYCKVPDHLPRTRYVPGEKEQARITCSPQVVTGVDKLKVALWLDWSNRRILDRLSVHKKGLQDTPHMTAPLDFFGSEYSDNFVLHRIGTTKFSYRLTSGDITLLISSRAGSSSLHNTQVEIGSLSSQIDAQAFYLQLIKMFARLGAVPVKEIVSEIHLAVDLLGIKIQDTGFSDNLKWITRADKFSIFLYRSRLSGISIGSGHIMFRAYDKILEMKTKRETAKENFFANKWGVDIKKTPVTRCEFQLRREVLKEFDVPVTTVSEIFSNLQALWIYCTSEWTRFCSAPVDRKNKNQSHSKLSEYWELLQTVFFSTCEKIASRVRQICVKNIGALAQQFRGLAMSLVASCGVKGTDVKDVIYWAKRSIEEEITRHYRRDPVFFARQMQVRFNECYVTANQ